MVPLLTIGRHFECGSQTKLVGELELALIKRYLSCEIVDFTDIL